MNDKLPKPANEPPRPPVQVGPVHYQILCAGGLALVFLAQLDQGLMLGNLLVACVGILGITSPMRAAPLLMLVALVSAQIGHHFVLHQGFDHDDRPPLLQVREVLLAMGVVTFVASNYRLQSLWSNILPIDRRQRRRPTIEHGGRPRDVSVPVEQKRAGRLLAPEEIVAFVIAVPLAALAGQVLWFVIAVPVERLFELFFDQPPAPRFELLFDQPRVAYLVRLVWLLVVGGLVTGAVLIHWRRRQMTQPAAQMCLQDVLWRETRREQRRIFRWLAWRRLHERAERPGTEMQQKREAAERAAHTLDLGQE